MDTMRKYMCIASWSNRAYALRGFRVHIGCHQCRLSHWHMLKPLVKHAPKTPQWTTEIKCNFLLDFSQLIQIKIGHDGVVLHQILNCLTITTQRIWILVLYSSTKIVGYFCNYVLVLSHVSYASLGFVFFFCN